MAAAKGLPRGTALSLIAAAVLVSAGILEESRRLAIAQFGWYEGDFLGIGRIVVGLLFIAVPLLFLTAPSSRWLRAIFAPPLLAIGGLVIAALLAYGPGTVAALGSTDGGLARWYSATLVVGALCAGYAVAALRWAVETRRQRAQG